MTLSGISIAQERVELWTRVNVSAENWIRNSTLQFEFQYRDQYLTRYQDLDQKTYSFRPWIKVRLGENGFFLQSSPLAFFLRTTDSDLNESSLREWRITQLAGYQLVGFPLEFRGGIEFRSFQGESNLRELRYRARIQSVILKKKAFQPKLSLEYFYRQGKEEGMFDQFRALAAVGRTSKGLDIELGYQYHLRQNVFRQKSNSNILYINLTPKI